MNEPTNDNDIDALLRYLLTSGHTQHWNDDSTRWRAAITALVAERNALRVELANGKSFWRPLDDRRNTEQRQESDRDLRERLMCAAMQSIAGMSLHGLRWDECGKAVYECADAAIAAMRKGEA